MFVCLFVCPISPKRKSCAVATPSNRKPGFRVYKIFKKIYYVSVCLFVCLTVCLFMSDVTKKVRAALLLPLVIGNQVLGF